MTCTIVHYQRNRASLYRGFGGAWWFGCGAFCFPLFSLFYYLLLWWPIFVIVTLTLVIYVLVPMCKWYWYCLPSFVDCSNFTNICYLLLFQSGARDEEATVLLLIHSVVSWCVKLKNEGKQKLHVVTNVNYITHSAPFEMILPLSVCRPSRIYQWRLPFKQIIVHDQCGHLTTFLCALRCGYSPFLSSLISLSLSPHSAGWLRLYILYKKRQPIIHTR